MASIGEVARRAGVSITTVSRVLNPVSEYPVAAATRRRVLAAAAALQYSPSALARALVTRRSRMVGVLLGDIVDPYFAEIVRGIEDVARRSGYLVVVCNTSRDPGTERRYVTALRDYRAHLERTREHNSLFDTAGFARDWEALLLRIYDEAAGS